MYSCTVSGACAHDNIMLLIVSSITIYNNIMSVMRCAIQIYNTHIYNVWLIGLLALVQGLTGTQIIQHTTTASINNDNVK